MTYVSVIKHSDDGRVLQYNCFDDEASAAEDVVAQGGFVSLAPGGDAASWRVINGALAFVEEPLPPLAQILKLEASVTQRRLREAALGVDSGWLAGLDAQIAALREQL